MIRSTDVGSLPLYGDVDIKKFSRLAESYNSLRMNLFPGEYGGFTDTVLKGFADKLDAGVDIPNYPQFRDMSEMFLRNIEGIEKVNGKYSWEHPLSITKEKARIAEVSVLRDNLRGLAEKAGGKAELKVCLTGPDSLASQLENRTNVIYTELSEVLSKITKENVFDEKHGRVALVSIDEPSFGVDNPNLDYGSGRDRLLKAWNDIAYEARQVGAKTILHLHYTSNPLFWESDVNVIESHVGDLIYTTAGTKRLLEKHDKFLKAPIAVAQFEDLIMQKVRLEDLSKPDDSKKIAVEWERIRTRKADPASYLEDSGVIKKRLEKIVRFFGEERMPYAGPECGFKGYYVGNYSFYDCAIKYLGRIASVVKDYNASAKAA